MSLRSVAAVQSIPTDDGDLRLTLFYAPTNSVPDHACVFSDHRNLYALDFVVSFGDSRLQRLLWRLKMASKATEESPLTSMQTSVVCKEIPAPHDDGQLRSYP